MDFGEILTKAWKIIWKFKVLWIFGILTSCGQGSSGGGGGGNTGVQYSRGDADLPHGMRNFFYGMENFFNNIQGWQIAGLIIGAILFSLILLFVFSALSTVGRIGLIQGTVKAESGVESLTFGELFNHGKPFFWRIFGFNILFGIAIFILVLLLIVPFIATAVLTLGFGLICLIPIICLLVPVSWLVTILIEQINIAIVVEDLDILAGIRHGWDVFRENIVNMIVMGLILGIGGFIIGFILALPLIMVMLPAAIGFFGGVSSGSEVLFGGGIAVAIICLVTYLPVLIVLNGILQSYIKTAWTLTYLRLAGGEISKAEPDISIEDDQEPESEAED